jgi:hypothetical protein
MGRKMPDIETAKSILKMIETVDPADTTKMDEIDINISCNLRMFPAILELREKSVTES